MLGDVFFAGLPPSLSDGFVREKAVRDGEKGHPRDWFIPRSGEGGVFEDNSRVFHVPGAT